ncbi:LTA synthase family protein [Cohnella fermenti]|nr:LTA synthase family protein [Cohnella fermenti]
MIAKLNKSLLFIAIVVVAYIQFLFFSGFTGSENSARSYFYTFFLIVLIASLISMIPKLWIRNSVSMTLHVVYSAILMIDIVYYRYFNDFISVFSLAYAGQVSEVSDSLGIIIRKKDFLILLGIPVISALLWAQRRSHNSANIHLYIKISTLMLSLLVIIQMSFYIHKDENAWFKNMIYKPNVVKDVGIINYHILDIISYERTNLTKGSISQDQIGELQDRFSESVPHGTYFGTAQGKNVIVVQEESMQNFLIGLNVDGEEVTPNLNQLIKDKSSIYFKNVFDQTSNGRTSDAELLSQTSLLPISNGSTAFQYGSNKYSSIAKIVQKYGYTTLSAHPADITFWNRNVTHKSYGFEKSLFINELTVDEVVGWGLSDESLFRQVTNKLQEYEKPFYAYLITLSNHSPYDRIPDQYQTLNVGELEGTTLGNYLQGAHYADYAIGKLIEDLKAKDLYENTVLVVFGDHDSGIAPREIVESTHVAYNPNYNLETSLDQIPLIIHSSGLQGREVTDVAGQIDIAPTLLNLLGIDDEDALFFGNDILSNAEHRVFIKNGTAITNEFMYDANKQKCVSTTGYVTEQQCSDLIDSSHTYLESSDTMIKYDAAPIISSYIKSYSGNARSGLNHKTIDTIPAESEEVQVAIAPIEQKGNGFTVNGWAFVKDEDAEDSVVYLILEKDQTFIAYDTKQVPRPDVVDYFKGAEQYLYSGWASDIAKVELEAGQYNIGVMIWNDGHYYYRGSELKLTI